MHDIEKADLLDKELTSRISARGRIIITMLDWVIWLLVSCIATAVLSAIISSIYKYL